MKELYEMTEDELDDLKSRMEAAQNNGYTQIWVGMIEREQEQRKVLSNQEKNNASAAVSQ